MRSLIEFLICASEGPLPLPSVLLIKQNELPSEEMYMSGKSLYALSMSVAEKLAKATASSEPIIEQYKMLCMGAPLPTDNKEIAKSLLDDLIKQMRERHILFDISDLPLNTAAEINIARQRLENILAQTDEIQYAKEQCNQWQEIRDYMTLLIKGGGKLVYDEHAAIEVPKDETPAYLEWTLWRAALAIDHMVNKPYEVRGFKLDSDFMPVSAAGGGKGD